MKLEIKAEAEFHFTEDLIIINGRLRKGHFLGEEGRAIRKKNSLEIWENLSEDDRFKMIQEYIKYELNVGTALSYRHAVSYDVK